MDSTIRKILGLREEEESGEEKSKLLQEIVVYLTPEQIGDEKGAHCGGCIFFDSGASECALTTPAKCNSENGVCALFLGRPEDWDREADKPIGLIPKKSVGYVENAPTKCSICEYWKGNAKDDPDADPDEKGACEKVEGTIQAGGCCNRWEEC